ncbi:ribbon-helix-helix domain-containing protein [Rhodococcus sp. ARC_M6]|uniref:ribbon-helix-helix domain-containing protein n=1 Tax=Rhodococcus sp. ARC_M6 TaxID=2928852 RepID=UPI001FB20EC7|nr:ribbon-helix-helix domain-containing protein [Rhodococcus sp. ARC_M6]MCJ0907330.1 ribbon-helix-helix domain-containing protein [Rhodococcus sp. ARC_M6]
MAEKRFDTNVTIPKSALDRLSEIVRMPGYKSRDQTGRYLILKYIERNEIIPADDRLTHISTVMRHPLPPIRVPNKDIAILDPVAPTRGLKLRLPEGVSGQARSLAFRLPGQSQFRGPSDYQSRLLTDAAMTSIAYECCELGLTRSPIRPSMLLV